ncbi:hypothetical protein A3860_39355 [Niastella vici]|uniref:Uncharacterized protein n=1 Tax=Niastella vici TaxID=1703345 RepID=A0A1V9FKH7_9BACT|nr:hypothetical protein [Niastella vici]OQP58830.1 hypothetical protein A3860_39355 [Niastella vici]
MIETNKITVEKLEIYWDCRGDGDHFARSAKEKERKLFSNGEWRLIDELLSDYALVKRNLAAEQYEQAFYEKLEASFYDHEAKERFYELCDEMEDWRGSR